MKKLFFLLCIVSLVSFFVGCASEKVESSKEAISVAQSMKTAEEKVNYLIAQAKMMYNSKQFQDAIDIAQHILRYLDKDSREAQQIIENAKKALSNASQGAVEDIKKGFTDW